jgi:hypothetical protein
MNSGRIISAIKSENESFIDRHREVLGLIVGSSILALMVGLLYVGGALQEYNTEWQQQKACYDEYGPSAEYIGSTDGYDAAAICRVNGGYEYAKIPDRNAPMDGFVHYLKTGETRINESGGDND